MMLVFSHSSLYEKITEQDLLPHKPMTVGSVDVPLYLIGDSAYPLRTWLMKPFTHGTSLTTEQKTYNYRLCRAQIVV